MLDLAATSTYKLKITSWAKLPNYIRRRFKSLLLALATIIFFDAHKLSQLNRLKVKEAIQVQVLEYAVQKAP